MAKDDDNERELFERALESMSPSEVYRGKYGERTEDGDDDPVAPVDHASREELARLREERAMQDAFEGIDRIEKGKYHQPPPKSELADSEFGAAEEEFRAAMAGRAPADESEPEPKKPERPSLAEQAGDDVEALNLRGMKPDKALSQLGVFIDLASKDGHRFVQLKIGSNEQLLKAVAEWLRGPGSVYTLEFETAQAHADAMIFARIRRQDPS